MVVTFTCRQKLLCAMVVPVCLPDSQSGAVSVGHGQSAQCLLRTHTVRWSCPVIEITSSKPRLCLNPDGDGTASRYLSAELFEA